MKQIVAAVIALIIAAILICLSIWMPWEKKPLIPLDENSSQAEPHSSSSNSETADDRGVRLLQTWEEWEQLAREGGNYIWVGYDRVVNLNGFSSFVNRYETNDSANCTVLYMEDGVPTSYQLTWQKGEEIRAMAHTLTAGGGVQKSILSFDGIYERESAYILQGYDGSLVLPKQAAPQWELMEDYAPGTSLSSDGLTPEEGLDKALLVDLYLREYLDDNWSQGREDAFDPMGTAIPEAIIAGSDGASNREGEVTGAARISGQLYYQATLAAKAAEDQAIYYVRGIDGGKIYRAGEGSLLTLVWDDQQKYYSR